MPKRSRSPEKEKKPIIVSTFEKWNVDTFNEINQLALPPDVEGVLSLIEPEINKKTTRRRADYRAGDFEQGRVYATGYQSVSAWIRRLCAHEYYTDVDIANCGPVLFVHVLTEHNIEIPPILASYAQNRQDLIKLIQVDNQTLNEKEIKKLLLSALHNGGCTGSGDAGRLLNELKDQTKICAKQLRKVSPKYSRMWKNCVESKKENPTGCFVASVWQEIENQTIMHLHDYFEKVVHVRVGALIFDGLMVEKHNIDLRAAEKYVLDMSTVKIDLVEKSLQPTASDLAKLLGEKSINKIKTDQAKQCYILTRHAQLAKLKRRDGFIMVKHPTIPGVYVRGQQDTEYINFVLARTNVGKELSMKRLVEWFGSVDSPVFELLTPTKINRHIISFINGFFDIDEMKFTNWKDFDIDKNTPPLTDHYFEDTFDLDEITVTPTPLWDNLLTTQLGPRVNPNDTDKSLITMLEMMIGRCFYETGKFDNFQLAIFIRGDGATGKSTVLDIIKSMFPPASVGCITATHEPHFGLEGLYTKRVVLVPDVPKHMSRLLAQSDFQSMVSGDSVSIARKNKMAVCEGWKPQLVFASNLMLDYQDNAGSVSRRLCVFSFTELITERNNKLKEDIIRQELVAIVVRCLLTYRQIIAESGRDDFWSKIAPPALRELQSEVKQETSFLAAFLANGDDYYQIIFTKGSLTPLSDLEKAYSNHMKFRQKEERARLPSDHHAIKSAGFTVERLNLCKTCHLPCVKQTCGDHYNRQNRYRKMVVRDMIIRNKSEIGYRPESQGLTSWSL